MIYELLDTAWWDHLRCECPDPDAGMVNIIDNTKPTSKVAPYLVLGWTYPCDFEMI